MTRMSLLAAASTLMLAAGALAGADVLLTPFGGVGEICDTIEIDLVLSSNDGANEPFDAIDAIITWDPAVLEMIGKDDGRSNGGFLLSGFLPDQDGINDDVTDGEALYTALALPGDPLEAPPAPDGLIVTTLKFRAVVPYTASIVDFTPEVGQYGRTRVLFEGATITGSVDDDATVQGGTCAGDIDADGEIRIQDLIRIVSAWGPCDGCCSADVAGDDDFVGIDDLLTVLVAWGNCP